LLADIMRIEDKSPSPVEIDPWGALKVRARVFRSRYRNVHVGVRHSMSLSIGVQCYAVGEQLLTLQPLRKPISSRDAFIPPSPDVRIKALLSKCRRAFVYEKVISQEE
jgi:hypothetical protein